nr:hypothetical protein [Tanacetum cinerariifolium]
QINKIDFINAGESDSKEIENFLNDDSIPIGVENSEFNMEEDVLFLEGLLIEDPSPPPPMIPNQTKSFIKEPEDSFSMGYEHFSTTLVTKEVVESSTKNLVPIPHECEIDNLDEFSGPLIPIHIDEEKRIRREHADYIDRIKMFTINPRPHDPVNANTNVESFSSLPIPVQDNDYQREEIDIISSTGDVLPPVVRNTIVKFDFDARAKFDVSNENDDLYYFMFVNVFSLLFVESEDTIFDPIVSA